MGHDLELTAIKEVIEKGIPGQNRWQVQHRCSGCQCLVGGQDKYCKFCGARFTETRKL